MTNANETKCCEKCNCPDCPDCCPSGCGEGETPCECCGEGCCG